MIYQVLADGEPWIDSDGLTEWPYPEALSLGELLESLGYEVELVGSVTA